MLTFPKDGPRPAPADFRGPDAVEASANVAAVPQKRAAAAVVPRSERAAAVPRSRVAGTRRSRTRRSPSRVSPSRRTSTRGATTRGAAASTRSPISDWSRSAACFYSRETAASCASAAPARRPVGRRSGDGRSATGVAQVLPHRAKAEVEHAVPLLAALGLSWLRAGKDETVSACCVALESSGACDGVLAASPEVFLSRFAARSFQRTESRRRRDAGESVEDESRRRSPGASARRRRGSGRTRRRYGARRVFKCTSFCSLREGRMLEYRAERR